MKIRIVMFILFYNESFISKSGSSFMSAMLNYYVATGAQKGQTKYWLHIGPFTFFTTFMDSIVSPSCLKEESEVRGIQSVAISKLYH